MSKVIDLTGKKFGAWTVLGSRGSNHLGQTTWLCLCECGVERTVVAQPLREGKTKSCGCMKADLIADRRITHGASHGDDMGKSWEWPPEYRAWRSMRRRCSPGNKHTFTLYAGRGITVCPRWQASYDAFFADMGPIPRPGMTLDRTDNDKGYELGNCRWADAQAQALNRQIISPRRAA